MEIREVNTAADVETLVLGFIDVLDRTRETNELAMRLVREDAYRASLEKDNAVLLDLRNRIWRQFKPCIENVLQ